MLLLLRPRLHLSISLSLSLFVFTIPSLKYPLSHSFTFTMDHLDTTLEHQLSAQENNFSRRNSVKVKVFFGSLNKQAKTILSTNTPPSHTPPRSSTDDRSSTLSPNRTPSSKKKPQSSSLSSTSSKSQSFEKPSEKKRVSDTQDDTQPQLQHHISWKVSFQKRLPKLSRSKPPSSFSYTTQDDDNETRFGGSRSSILDFHGLPPLHSLEPALSVDEIEEIVNLICQPDQTSQSPTFMKYNQQQQQQHQPLLLATPACGSDVPEKSLLQHPLSKPKQSAAVSVVSPVSLPVPVVVGATTTSTSSTPSTTEVETNKNLPSARSHPKSSQAKYRDIYKLHSNNNNSHAELYRRYSDAFRSNKRRISHRTAEEQHPWCDLKESTSSSSSSSSSSSASSSSSYSSSASSAHSTPLPSPTEEEHKSFPGHHQHHHYYHPRHPEVLRSSWKNVAQASDPTKIYALANEIANHRIKERRTILQLRLMRERNKARWAFDSIPRVHIKITTVQQSPSPSSSSSSPSSSPQRNAASNLNDHYYSYSYLNSQPCNMELENRISRINSRQRQKVISHYIINSENTNGSPSNNSLTTAAEQIIQCQTAGAKFQLMRSSCATFMNKTVQGYGTVLPKGQFMAKLIMLNQQPKQRAVVDRYDDVVPSPAMSATIPYYYYNNYNNSNTAVSSPRPNQWSLNTDVLTVMPKKRVPRKSPNSRYRSSRLSSSTTFANLNANTANTPTSVSPNYATTAATLYTGSSSPQRTFPPQTSPPRSSPPRSSRPRSLPPSLPCSRYMDAELPSKRGVPRSYFQKFPKPHHHHLHQHQHAAPCQQPKVKTSKPHPLRQC